jgi:hypothetical protein
VADVSDELRAALTDLPPEARDLLRRALVRDEGKQGATSVLFVFGEGGGGDHLVDDLVYAINRQTLDADEKRKVVRMLDEIAESE